MSRNGAARPDESTPMAKWLVLPMVLLAYFVTSATAATPRDRDHDGLPDRFLDESLEVGSGRVAALTRERLDAMIGEYYAARGLHASGLLRAEQMQDLHLREAERAPRSSRTVP